MSAPKPGDRVRVTFEGVVERPGVRPSCDYTVRVANRFSLAASLSHAESIEVLEPARPEWADRVGVIVVDKFGYAWQHHELDNWRSTLNNTLTYERLVKPFGPLTVVHDPEASA